MKRAHILFTLITLFFSALLHAQNVTVSGTVKDANGPLTETSIQEKGISTNGTIADRDGNFSITLKGKSMTLIFKRVGYAEQEVKVNTSQRTLNVIMQPSDQGLDQVIVVGYGTKKRVTNTGAVSSISADAIRNIPTANVQNSLQGKLPGFFFCTTWRPAGKRCI